MKKNVLMKSKRMAAFALSLSMVLAEGSLVSAAEMNAVSDSAVVDETGTEVTDAVDVQTTGESQTTETTADAGQTTESTEADAPEVSADAVQVTPEETVPAAPEEATSEDVVLDEENSELANKITTNTTLGDVTGLAFDAAAKRLSWNKVPGASDYEITIYNADGTVYSSENWSYGNVFYNLNLPADTDYEVGVRAVNENEYYVSETNVPESEVLKTDAQGNRVHPFDTRVATKLESGYVYTLYRYPRSANEAKLKFRVPAASSTVTALTSIQFKEFVCENAVFTVAPEVLLRGEIIAYEYANNAEFKNDEEKSLFAYRGTDSEGEEIKVNLYNYNPGDTIYLRARVVKGSYDPDDDDYYYGSSAEYSPYVTTQYTVPKADITSVKVNVTSSSVRLNPVAENGRVTGYQYQRKNGKKWMDIGKTGDHIIDKGLKKNTKYSYRVRGYSYNKMTNRTVYTDWAKVSAYTWGSSLNVKASAVNSKSVKLTWDKVDSANGYEIYRCENCSQAYNYNGSDATDDHCNLKLIKTIKKAKTKSFKDKKLTPGETYHYVVRAYKNVGKTKNYIEGAQWITLSKTASLSSVTKYYNAKGQYVVSWGKMTGISGYKVDKKDPVTGKYVSYKTLGKTKTSITFPAVQPGEASVSYRIAPYSGSKVYQEYETVTVAPKLAVVKNVKAVQTDNGVKVTWNAVAGADYYRVWRATQDAVSYDKKTKVYQRPGAVEVYDTYYDVSESTNLAPVGKNEAGRNTYDPNLRITDGKFLYKNATSYHTTEVTGTSATDLATVQSLIFKTDDPAYDSAADPEYTDRFGEYRKNADGSLATETYMLESAPEEGNTYFYFVEAVAKANNGTNGYHEGTRSVGYTKGAKVTYTNVTAKATKVKSAKSSKKAQATISIKKVSGANGYAIYRSNKKNGTYDLVGTTTGKSFTDKNVTSGKTYYYKVASYKTSENGSYVYSKLSSAKKVKVK